MKYKYKVEEKNCERQFSRGSQAESDYLQRNGMDGWELVSVVPYAPTLTFDHTTYYWKMVDEK